MKQPNIIFAGTPDFALVSLQGLVAANAIPRAVLTQPDRPAGRGKQLKPGAVKRYAQAHGIPVMQPPSLRDDAVIEALVALEPDLIIVAAYGLLLPQRVLDIPAAGCLNVHASLLPRWRGAAPIQASILAGDERTGVCLMRMTAGLDCGPVFVCESIEIGGDETAGELHDRLAALGADLLVRHLPKIASGKLTPVAQDESLAISAPKISRADAQIDWRRPAAELKRHIRAFNPVPGAWFLLDGEAVKCWSALTESASGAAPGRVLAAGKDGVVVACGEGALRLTRLQRPGRRPVSAGEFAGQFDLIGREL